MKQNIGKRELAALNRLLLNTIRNVEEQGNRDCNGDDYSAETWRMIKAARAYRDVYVLSPLRDMLAIIETAIARSPSKAAHKKSPAWMWRK